MVAALVAGAFHVRRRATHYSCAMLDLGFLTAHRQCCSDCDAQRVGADVPRRFFLSWNALLILMYAIAAPTTPGRMFAACLVAASI